jgi:Leucine-rich repeat (LRR) protein
MHDIALSVLGEECATITNRPGDKKFSKHTRHLFSTYDATETHLINFLKKQTPAIQTLLCPYPDPINWMPVIPKYNSMRAIRVPRFWKFKIIPRHLQHLRYLDLSENWWIKQLPEEISILYHLKTLNVSGCRKLCRLPRDMKYMASLRHLYTDGCISLKCMPLDLGLLRSLQILTYFVVGNSSGCSAVGQLQNLDLGGKLMLSCLENVIEAQAQAARLGNKEKLKHLALEWSSKCHEEPVANGHKKVLEALKPHSGLEMLRIVRYKSACLPTWMKDLNMSHKHLTELHLIGFTNCEEFVQFSHLEALQILHLEDLDKLPSLCGNERSLTFLKLKKLELRNLKSMENWVAREGRGRQVAFPQLENLVIRECPKLATLPETPNLKVMELDEGKAQLSLLVARAKYMSLLSKLKLSVRDKDAALSLTDENIESPLLELTLSGCNFLFLSGPSEPTTGIWRCFGKLVSLYIYGCDALIYWPEDVFQSLVSLKHLDIFMCQNLVGPTQVIRKPMHQILPHLTSLNVSYCERLAELFHLPPSITEIDILLCKSLKFVWEEDTESKSVHMEQQRDTSSSLEYYASTSVLKQSPTQTNHPLLCMESLTINSCHNMVELQNLPPALKSLHIISCPKLCYVSGQLDAVKHLRIYGCNELRSLDSLGYLPSLENLSLEGCKRLTSLPGSLGSYSALQRLTIQYCPAIDMEPLYGRHQQRLDSLEHRDLSHAHSSDPDEGSFQSIVVLYSAYIFSSP